LDKVEETSFQMNNCEAREKVSQSGKQGEGESKSPKSQPRGWKVGEGFQM
jgi:hypothetical protein